MKYSEIVGKGFYNIQLPAKMQFAIDVHFSGASHHLYRYREAMDTSPQWASFHLERHKAHLRHLMEIVYEYGDFSNAYDYSLRDMDEKESWNPDLVEIPDPEMFGMMLPDARFAVSEAHPYDLNLKNLRPAQSKSPSKKIKFWLIANS